MKRLTMKANCKERMSGPATPPSTATKAATSKPTAKVPSAIELPTDYGDALSSIERDLNHHRIGTFCIFRKDMNFEWGDRKNRDLSRMDRMGVLLKSMQNGLYRTDIRHRMSGVVSVKQVEGRILLKGSKEPIPLDKVKEHNDQAVFPILAFPKAVKRTIEMQSGQHRMAVLKVLYPEEEQNWWWIVTLYDDSTSDLSLRMQPLILGQSFPSLLRRH